MVNNKKSFKRRNFSEKNISKFKKYASRIIWDPVYNSTEMNSAYSFFHDVLKLIMNATCPVEEIKIKYENRYPWLSKYLLESIIQKNNMYIESALEPDDTELLDNYNSYKNNVTSQLRNAELKYYSEQLETNKHDIAKSWKIIKEITGLNSSNTTNAGFIINGNIVNDKTAIAIEFNNFFVNIGPELASNINSTGNPLSYINNIACSIVIPTVSEYDIMKNNIRIK